MHALRISFFGALALCSSSLCGQQASISSFGAPSNGTGTIAVSAPPSLGTTITVSVAFPSGGTSCTTALSTWEAWLLMGSSNQQWSQGPLPAQIAGFTLLVSPDAILTTGPVQSFNGCPPGFSSGRWDCFNLTVPNSRALLGAQFYQQVLYRRAINVPSLPAASATDGLELTLGL